jgi:phosphate transport system substrate-binding protein
VAERFGRSSDFKTPKVESTGSGGGLKLFCDGIGVDFPDIANASRAIKGSEVRACAANGVSEIIEVKIGYDGIVIANAAVAADVSLTRRDIFLALAKEVPGGADGELIANPYQTWRDVNPALPAQKIEVLGPPPTSGTRDAFVELAMEGGCKTFAWIESLKDSDSDQYKAICHMIREDGNFVEAGENDNLIVQKLEANPSAFGIFGFSFLDQNGEKVKARRLMERNQLLRQSLTVVTRYHGHSTFTRKKRTLTLFPVCVAFFVSLPVSERGATKGICLTGA